jgi:hypothetical protein
MPVRFASRAASARLRLLPLMRLYWLGALL